MRAMITVAGNPVASNPNADRLDAAFASLEFMVSIDPYINETTRHADVILPPPSALEKSHYDLALLNFAVRNVANYSPAVLPMRGRSAGRVGDPAAPDGDRVGLGRAGRHRPARRPGREHRGHRRGARRARPGCGLRHRRTARGGRAPPRPERVLDLMLRTGPYDLTLADLEASPHGIDLGPLEPDRIPDLLRTPSGKIELLPDPMRTRSRSPRTRRSTRDWAASMVLVGRRHVRSNNSWMHNIRVLTKGRNRCTLQVHPDDADRLGLTDGAPARCGRGWARWRSTSRSPTASAPGW